MKILFVSEYFYPRIAGGEKWAFELCKELVKKGHSVTVVTSKFENNTKNENVLGIKIIRFSTVGNLNNPVQRFRFVIKLKKFLDNLLKKEKFDVIHSMAYIANIPASYAAKKHKIKSITSVHVYFGLIWFKITNPFSALLNYLLEKSILLLDKSDIIHVPSKHVYDKLLFISNKRKKVILNFVDISEDLKKSGLNENKIYLRKKYEMKKDELLLLAIGNLQKIKNFDGLIKALIPLERPYKLFIIGEGEERKNLEKIVSKNELKDKIILLGKMAKPKVLNCMKQADTIIIPSYEESFSYIMAESLILSKTTVALKNIGISNDFKKRIRITKKDKLNNFLLKFSFITDNNKDINMFNKNKTIKKFEEMYKLR